MNDHMMDSFCEVELFQNTPYYAGGEVSGNIHVFAKNNLNNASKITLRLKGEEIVTIAAKKAKD